MTAALVLGTAQFGHAYGIANRVGRLGDDQIDAVIRTAVDCGVRRLDTAAAYGDAEDRIGQALARLHLQGDVAVDTKLEPLDDLSQIDASLERSRRRLGVDPHVCYVHRAADFATFGEQLLERLAAHQQAGRITAIGASVYADEVHLVNREWNIGCVQFPCNLLDRRIDPTGFGDPGRPDTHARSVFLQGLLAMEPDRLPARLAHAAPVLRALREIHPHPADVALSFVAHTPGIDRVVVGVESPGQMERNAAAIDTPPPAGLRAMLEDRLADVPAAVIDPRQWEAP